MGELKPVAIIYTVPIERLRRSDFTREIQNGFEAQAVTPKCEDMNKLYYIFIVILDVLTHW